MATVELVKKFLTDRQEFDQPEISHMEAPATIANSFPVIVVLLTVAVNANSAVIVAL